MPILRVAGDEVDDVLLASIIEFKCFVQQMQGKWIESRITLAFIDGKMHDKHLVIDDLGIFQ